MTLETYDPNIQWGTHTIEITYQMWEYTFTTQVEIGGNCKGMSLLKDAVSEHGNRLFKEQGNQPEIIMTAPNGDTLENTCDHYLRDDDDEPDIDEWLESMCVCVRIVKHAKEQE